MILEVAYPNAIRCGMTKHEFFHSTMKDVNIRIRDHQEKEENRVKELEYVAWMNGLYIRAAVASAFSKKAQYPENPLEQKVIVEDMELTEEEKEKYRKSFVERLQRMQQRFNNNKNGGDG